MKKLPLLLLFVITACSLVAPEISILDNPTCDLPCWNDIAPGKTSQPETLQIIANLEGIDKDKTNVLNAPWLIFNKRIWFYLYTDSSLARVQTDGAVYFIDDKVAALLLQRNIGRTFGEIVELVGEPESIISMITVGGDVAIAIVPSKGVVLEFYPKSDKLQAETRIDAMMFFDTSHYEELLDAGMFSLGEYDANETRKIMYPWKGYGSIEELYPPRFP
jgi:hypothetical protein